MEDLLPFLKYICTMWALSWAPLYVLSLFVVNNRSYKTEFNFSGPAVLVPPVRSFIQAPHYLVGTAQMFYIYVLKLR